MPEPTEGNFFQRRRKYCELKVIVGTLFLTAVGGLLYLKFTANQQPATPLALEAEQEADKQKEGTTEKMTERPGDGGKPHRLSPQRDFETRRSNSKYGMNVECSDEIPLNRTVPDFRHAECELWEYPEILPEVSVVVVFLNEGFSVLMRTIHSVMDRTPPTLLHEVILINDDSQNATLNKQYLDYVARWNGTVQLILNDWTEGPIASKIRGAEAATGEVIVFLDAHCEVGKGWLPPLLAPISKSRKTMTVPVIDIIDSNTFEVKRSAAYRKGIFEWGLIYKEVELTNAELNATVNETAPYNTPTHGGMFAINREYFLEIGLYDAQLSRGENMALSFKMWQCGGRILWVPCSRVAHVYKTRIEATEEGAPFNLTSLTSYKRVVETWMDDKHKEYFYTREPSARFLDMGDITEQLELKDELYCHNFQWYMDIVASDVLSYFPAPPPNQQWGVLVNNATRYCLSPTSNDVPTSLTVTPCLYNSSHIIRLTDMGQLGLGEWCIDWSMTEVKLLLCPLGKVGGHWTYNRSNHLLYHTALKQCLAADSKTYHVILSHCNPLSLQQQWSFLSSTP